MTQDRLTALTLVWLLAVAVAGYIAVPVVVGRRARPRQPRLLYARARLRARRRRR